MFGQVKEGQGFRRFMRRGLGAAQSEWSLAGMTHNLLKLWRSGQAPWGWGPGPTELREQTTFLGADKRPVELDGPTSLEAHRSHTCVSQLAHRSMRQTHKVMKYRLGMPLSMMLFLVALVLVLSAANSTQTEAARPPDPELTVTIGIEPGGVTGCRVVGTVDWTDFSVQSIVWQWENVTNSRVVRVERTIVPGEKTNVVINQLDILPDLTLNWRLSVGLYHGRGGNIRRPHWYGSSGVQRAEC